MACETCVSGFISLHSYCVSGFIRFMARGAGSPLGFILVYIQAQRKGPITPKSGRACFLPYARVAPDFCPMRVLRLTLPHARAALDFVACVSKKAQYLHSRASEAAPRVGMAIAITPCKGKSIHNNQYVTRLYFCPFR